MSKITSLQEKCLDDQVQMLIEAITMEDVAKLAQVFNDIEKIISNVSMPEIESVLDRARSELAFLQSEPFQQSLGIGSGKTQKALDLVGMSREARKKRQVVARIVAIQTMLTKLLQGLPDVLKLVKRDLPGQGQVATEALFRKYGLFLNEEKIRANALAKKLGISFKQLKAYANMANIKWSGNNAAYFPEDAIAAVSQLAAKEKGEKDAQSADAKDLGYDPDTGEVLGDKGGSAKELAQKLGIPFEQLQSVGDAVGTNIGSENSNVSPESAEKIEKYVSGAKDRTMAGADYDLETGETTRPPGAQDLQPGQNKLGDLLGAEASRNFQIYITNLAKIKRGFINKLVKFGFGNDEESWPSPDAIAGDFLNMKYQDLIGMVDRVQNFQPHVGLTRNDAQVLDKSVGQDQQKRPPQSIGKQQNITYDELFKAWSSSNLSKGISPGVLRKLANSLKGKTIS